MFGLKCCVDTRGGSDSDIRPVLDHGSDIDSARYLLASQSEQEGGAHAFIFLGELDENGQRVQSRHRILSLPPHTNLKAASTSQVNWDC